MRNLCVAALTAVIVGLAVFASTSAQALLVTTQAGDLVFEVLSGEGAPSSQEFGLGTPSSSSVQTDRDVVFIINLSGGVTSVTPSPVVNKGFFPAGSILDFYNLSDFGGSQFAYSSALGGTPSASDLVTFYDADNSLGFGGSVVEQLGVDDWVLHLDDAASTCCDDDDNEMVIRVRVVPASPPVTISEPVGFASLCLFCVAAVFIIRRSSAVTVIQRVSDLEEEGGTDAVQSLGQSCLSFGSSILRPLSAAYSSPRCGAITTV